MNFTRSHWWYVKCLRLISAIHEDQHLQLHLLIGRKCIAWKHADVAKHVELYDFKPKLKQPTTTNLHSMCPWSSLFVHLIKGDLVIALSADPPAITFAGSSVDIALLSSVRHDCVYQWFPCSLIFSNPFWLTRCHFTTKNERAIGDCVLAKIC